MIDRLDQKAAERGVSRSNLVVEALADYLDREIAA
jgi:predicted transcriptional regulator